MKATMKKKAATYSGAFMARLGPELHAKLARAAEAKGETMVHELKAAVRDYLMRGSPRAR